MRKALANPFYRFLLLFLGLYSAWYALYEYVLHPHTSFDRIVIDNIVTLARWVLSGLGYTAIYYDADSVYNNYLTFSDGSGVMVGPECDGIVLLALFLVFMLAYAGPIRHKLWFAPVGLIIIHLINVMRVVALALISHHAPQYLGFNHDYTFTILVYAVVFGLWYVWVTKWANKPVVKDAA